MCYNWSSIQLRSLHLCMSTVLRRINDRKTTAFFLLLWFRLIDKCVTTTAHSTTACVYVRLILITYRLFSPFNTQFFFKSFFFHRMYDQHNVCSACMKGRISVAETKYCVQWSESVFLVLRSQHFNAQRICLEVMHIASHSRASSKHL